VNRLERPNFFDDHVALAALANNRRVGSYPELLDHVAQIGAGYTQYVAVNGDATAVAPVLLPGPIATFLKGHYGSPPQDIGYIKEIRRRGGVSTCPMCGSMHSGTLDHVLDKDGYPAFAIFGLNLVPACKCNSLRGTALIGPNPGERILHPYFDDVLAERILAARFEDLGLIPRVSLRVLLDPADPRYAGVRFHVRNVVERTQITDYLRRQWTMLIKRPSRLTTDLRHDPSTLDALKEILARELERLDDVHDGKNNWNSIFMAGLLDDEVVDWLYDKFSRPDRVPNSPLVF
jgi:hypothetical protein